MKKFIFILVLVLILPMGAVGQREHGEAPAQEFRDADTEVKYEIVFTVKYNSESIASATQIINEVMSKHKDACKVDIDVGRVGIDTTDYGDRILWQDGNNTIILEDIYK